MVTKGSKIWSSSRESIPTPVSSTLSSTCGPSCETHGVERRALRHPHIVGLDGQPASSGHGVAGIESQIQQHLLDLARIGLDIGQIGFELAHQLDLLADGTPQQVLHAADDLVEIDRRRRAQLPATENQQLPSQRGGALSGLLDLIDLTHQRAAWLE